MKIKNQKNNIENQPQNLIQRLRTQKQMSLRDVATKADISASFLSEIERGTRSPSLKTIEAIASILGHRNELFIEYGLLTPEIQDLLKDEDVYRFLSKLAKISKVRRDTFIEVAMIIFSEA